MPCDFFALPHDGIQRLHPYVPGKSAATVKPKYADDVIKLASNENPLGCSPDVLEALSQLTPHQLATYTTGVEHPLREQMAAYVGVTPEMITLTNGSDRLFGQLLTCFALHTGRKMLTHDYAFITYTVQADTFGIPYVTTPINPDWTVNINAMIEAVQKDNIGIIFLANPNNPTGVPIPSAEIKRLLENIPNDTLLVLDEAYYDYRPPEETAQNLNLLKQYTNLLLTRTFSKAYGLASLRLGACIAHPDITALLYRIQLPFVVNLPALTSGMAALEDQDFVKSTVELNQQGLKQVSDGLRDLGYDTLPTEANFVMFDYGKDALPLYKALQDHGVIIRPLTPYGLKQHFRVSIGTLEQNERFLQTFKECHSS